MGHFSQEKVTVFVGQCEKPRDVASSFSVHHKQVIKSTHHFQINKNSIKTFDKNLRSIVYMVVCN